MAENKHIKKALEDAFKVIEPDLREVQYCPVDKIGTVAIYSFLRSVLSEPEEVAKEANAALRRQGYDGCFFDDNGETDKELADLATRAAIQQLIKMTGEK
jgi:hypothetical protein